MPDPTGFGEEQQPFDEHASGLASVGHVRLKIDKAGRVIIPAEMRAAMGAKPGEPLTAEVVDGELRIQSRAALLARMRSQGEKSRANHPESAVDELIADRRDEARREDAKYERLAREAGRRGAERK